MGTSPVDHHRGRPLSRLLPRFEVERENIRLSRKLARIMLETGASLPVRANGKRAAGDPAALRGLPAVGVRGGYGGAIAGTRPDTQRDLQHWPRPDPYVALRAGPEGIRSVRSPTLSKKETLVTTKEPRITAALHLLRNAHLSSAVVEPFINDDEQFVDFEGLAAALMWSWSENVVIDAARAIYTERGPLGEVTSAGLDLPNFKAIITAMATARGVAVAFPE